MSFMVTSTGQDFYLQGAGVLTNQIHIDDIAHALAQINRYTGHTTRPYSVAEHSLLVCEIAAHHGCSAVVQLGALMHDAHEAYIGDMSSPVKWAVGPSWSAFEQGFARLVRRQFGLQAVFASEGGRIKHFDLVALATERRDLTAYHPGHNAPWQVLYNIAPADWTSCCTLRNSQRRWDEWRDLFRAKFAALTRQIREQQLASLQSAVAETAPTTQPAEAQP